MRFGRDRELLVDPEAIPQAGRSVSELRDMGDNCRDRGLWADGARHYQNYLEKNPDDSAIWVQLGHCLKDSGSYHDADKAYDRALKLIGNDDDIFLHKGHLAKLMGSLVDAIYFYKKSLSLRYEGNDALKELLALGALDVINEVVPKYSSLSKGSEPITYLDITDLIDYLKINTSMSGIQRVISNIVKYSSPEIAEENVRRIELVISEYDRPEVHTVPASLVRALIDMLSGSGMDRQILDNALRAIYESRQRTILRPNDIFIIAGAFWIYREAPGRPGANYDMIVTLRSQGVKFGVFIHDLIQIKNPEYVHKEATLVFRKALIDVLTLANFVLTNSEYVAKEVREFLTERLNFSVPVKAVPLATELRESSQSHTGVGPEILDACRDEFVLCVCTIEVRKNHIYLIQIWEKMIHELNARVPNLIFVGKWGWEVDALQEYLENRDALGDWLHIFNGISDTELEYLYRHCLFTAFASFAEGWGLPVGESLAYGKPCVASNTTSIPEVGGELVRYVDPFDLRSGYDAIKQLVTDRSDLAEWTQQIGDQFRPKGWRTFCTELFDTVMALCQDSAGDGLLNNCILPSGEILFIGDDDVTRLDSSGHKLVTFRMARFGGWHPIEDWGVWASQRRARLQFRTDLNENDEIKLYLLLKVPPGSENAKCVVKAGAGETVLDGLAAQSYFYQADARIAARGSLEISLGFSGLFRQPETRSLFGGLTALGFCKSSDVLARLDLLEKVSLCQRVRAR